ncbi:DUF4270 domain-containing protein [Parapedobacter sp. SGR-10]|uniref:DUF4270 family protein n=1 Tax=Parapedobacter sp. SGR-10 TaxID=2710879 RepID=UPI0013D3C3C2|nr:DUF4270 family protein [Parapedobacter sp. SGR-10]NGF55855.1 DUF4270 domain-containing protein [Parapedobacter sp. SGR-10]
MSLGGLNEDIGVMKNSLPVQVSTVQLEYLPSANTGTLLVGKATRAEIGSTTASSYFRVELMDFASNLPEDATFESVNLLLTPNASRYYYGDTTQSQTFYVHRVVEDIETLNIAPIVGTNNVPVYVTGATIFSDQQFDYEAMALGSLTFDPWVQSIDTLSVQLDDAFGQEIFDKISTGHWDVSSNTNFQQYLKGLTIVPDDDNTVVLGLNDTIYLDINYSYMGIDGVRKVGKKVITTGSKAYQYNHVSYDRSGTDFSPLTHVDRELPSTATNGDVFIQAGTGVVAKLEFPSLKEFLNEPDIAVNKIELEVETTGDNYGGYRDPNAMMLLIANKYTGVPISFVRAPRATSIQTAPLVAGDTFGKNNRYTFNMIDYIKTFDDAVYAETCLYLAVSSPDIFGTVHTAMLAKEDNEPKIKLNIVYTKFR